MACFCLAPPQLRLDRHVDRRVCGTSPFGARRRASARRTVRASVSGGRVPEWDGDSSSGGGEIEFWDGDEDDSEKENFEDRNRFRELPLFPLGIVLNPGTAVPLHIFELRYRLLFGRIQDGDSRFGIVMMGPEGMARVGCEAELTRFESMPDGRIMTNNVGVERFKIMKILEEKPYIRAIVEVVQDDPPTDDLSELKAEVWGALQDVLRLSNKLYDKVLDLGPDVKELAGPDAVDGEGSDKGWPDAKRLQDFSFAVSQVLDMPLGEQQLLLQLRDTDKRLRRQMKMLESARQYLAAQVTIKEAGLGDW